MKRMRPRVAGALFVALVLGGVPACRDSSSAAVAPQDDSEAAEARRRNAPPPPDDYVRWKCTECSCRVFTGDGAYCNRPSCRHHWKVHQRPPAGG